MSSKFAALAANVSQTFKVEIIDQVTDAPIVDTAGKKAFIEVLSTDSREGLAFDKDKRATVRRKAMKSRNGIADPGDQLEENIQKCAALTKSWHLVDPVTREVIDVPCTPENAVELYSEPGMNWLFIQVWVEASKAANFMTRSSTTSSDSPSTGSAATVS
ncbi:hypothetical protein [Mesorhizobium sp.]|uniref:hypothetical protein n=1 Tax=Mesorhizobium sp. TaxID=1871066 RepID=UPI0025E82CFF|nr:hypothetical protein [Mesorhizobium sp.]